MAFPSWEPLLPDTRVERIASLLRIAHPDLADAEFVTFVVPRQVVRDRRSMRHAPHEQGCPYRRGEVDDCQCDPLELPEQAIFAIRSPHPKKKISRIYANKDLLTTESTWLHTWQAKEKERAHFVSTNEDPAYTIFRIAAKAHVEKQRGWRELN